VGDHPLASVVHCPKRGTLEKELAPRKSTMDSQEHWKIDVDCSTLQFSVRHKLLGEIRGQFRCWGGQLRLDGANPQKAAVRIWVELSSIDTGSRSRDDEILRTDLFDQRWEPALEFDGERLEIDASDHLALVGWLGLHSVRKKIRVAVDAYALEVGALKSPRFACSARASIDRRALGLGRTPGVGHWLSDQLLGDTIDIMARVEAALENPVAASRPATLAALRSWACPHAPLASLA
jgi:polyisoprenoid-binding protein YceI